ncbi:unnamed protein product [Tilletia laevis]|uniref:Cytochrome P450 n=2 Tax=Tilletia TaxID=13289 RepID=A0A177VGA2_9BASI|nr:hypothetical protein CF336_g383 [Tilletia laevis]KAE8256479.1 hypothetical protein A4X03_0g5365 [Tilletia caries]CAD6903959.1 unnamed protein product [Tilletia controversa]CAD6884439.1 unnamed protein product [Tilletia caries]CAD6903804.1 unnamed protein product [Tilletia caries]
MSSESPSHFNLLADARYMVAFGLVCALVLLGSFRQTLQRRASTDGQKAVPISNVASRSWYEPSAFAFAKHPYVWLFDAQLRYGDVFGMGLGFFRVIWLTGPEAPEFIFGADEDTLSFHKAIEPNISKLFPVRHLKQPWINYLVGGMTHRKHGKHFAQCVLDITESETARWARDTEKTGSTDLFQGSFDVMTLIISKYAFGDEFTDKHGAEICYLIFQFDALLGDIGVMATPDWAFWTKGNRKLKAHRQRFYEITNTELQRRLRHPELYKDCEDYLQYYQEGQSGAAAQMAQSKRVQAKLRSELASLGVTAQSFTDAKLNGTEEELLSTLENCSYLHGITHESMRLRPSPFLVQKAMKDIRYGEHVFEKGALLTLALPVINRNPIVFPCPDEFVPERFMDDAPADVRTPADFNLHSVFVPWGLGRRRCKGEKLAAMTIHTTLARMVLCNEVSIEGETTEPPINPLTGRENIVPIAPQLDKIFGPPHSEERCGLRLVPRADQESD